METKVCYKCKENLLVSSFKKQKSRKDGLQADCIQCQKEYRKEHYKKNREKYLARAVARRDKQRTTNRVWFEEYKLTLSCERCDESHIACLDFHHKDPSDKEYEVSRLVSGGFSVERIKEEISRCEVLCSNCHRKFHWEERNNKMPDQCDGRT